MGLATGFFASLHFLSHLLSFALLSQTQRSSLSEVPARSLRAAWTEESLAKERVLIYSKSSCLAYECSWESIRSLKPLPSTCFISLSPSILPFPFFYPSLSIFLYFQLFHTLTSCPAWLHRFCIPNSAARHYKTFVTKGVLYIGQNERNNANYFELSSRLSSSQTRVQ